MDARTWGLVIGVVAVIAAIARSVWNHDVEMEATAEDAAWEAGRSLIRRRR
jgi:hypothetical protein